MCACPKQERIDKHSLLVALIEETICSLEGQVVQVMPASVQHSSKASWNTQAHNEHPRHPQQQSRPEMVPRKADLCGILSPVVNCSLQAADDQAEESQRASVIWG